MQSRKISQRNVVLIHLMIFYINFMIQNMCICSNNRLKELHVLWHCVSNRNYVFGISLPFYWVNMYVVQQFAQPLNLSWMLIMCCIESAYSAFQWYVPLNNIYYFVILTTPIWHLFASTVFSGVSSYPGFSDIAIKIIVRFISIYRWIIQTDHLNPEPLKRGHHYGRTTVTDSQSPQVEFMYM